MKHNTGARRRHRRSRSAYGRPHRMRESHRIEPAVINGGVMSREIGVYLEVSLPPPHHINSKMALVKAYGGNVAKVTA